MEYLEISFNGARSEYEKNVLEIENIKQQSNQGRKQLVEATRGMPAVVYNETL